MASSRSCRFAALHAYLRLHRLNLGGVSGYMLYKEITLGLKGTGAVEFGIAIREFAEMMLTAEYNTLQLATIKRGRDSLITRQEMATATMPRRRFGMATR